MKIVRKIHFLLAAAALFVAAGTPARAQTRPQARAQTRAEAKAELERTRAALVAASEEYKASTRALIALKEQDAARREAKHEQLRQLVAEGLVSRRDLEESERLLKETRAALDVLRNQIGDADRLVAEVEAAAEAEEIAAAPAYSSSVRLTGKTGGPVYSPTAVIIKHTGRAHWTVSNVSSVQSFFYATFGRALPTSAVGQTQTHDRMGFDHSRAVDVAVHPDSPEGRALINYLHANGISFIAFRAAVPGSATGPHIHIGPPSGKM